jgi:hypothetical protein
MKPAIQDEQRKRVPSLGGHVVGLRCHLGWRTLLKCNKTNHACLAFAVRARVLLAFLKSEHRPGLFTLSSVLPKRAIYFSKDTNRPDIII